MTPKMRTIAILCVGFVLTACLNPASKQQQELHAVATNAEMAAWTPAERCQYLRGESASLSDQAKQDLLKRADASSCNPLAPK